MIRRDFIKSLAILTAGIVSGATLITETATEPIRVQGGIYHYIQTVGPDLILSRRQCEEFLGDLT